MTMRLFPELFRQACRGNSVAHYPDMLLDTLRASAPSGVLGAHGGGADAGHVQQRLFRACPSWPSKWGGNWSKARIWWSRKKTWSICAPPRLQRVDVIYRHCGR